MVQANVTDAEVADAYRAQQGHAAASASRSVTWRQIVVAPKPTPAARKDSRA